MKRMMLLHHLLKERSPGIMQVDQVVQAALVATLDLRQVVISLNKFELNQWLQFLYVPFGLSYVCVLAN